MRLLILAALGAAMASPSLAAVPGPARPADRCAPSEYATDAYFPAPAFPQQTGAPLNRTTTRFTVETLVSGLAKPRSLAFLDGGRLLVATGPGQLRIISAKGDLSAPLAGVPPVLSGDGGAHDIALDPAFAKNRILYLAYRAPKPGEAAPAAGARPQGVGRVVRARLTADGRGLEDVKVIFEGGYVRRIVAQPDGTLLISIGAFSNGPPQDLNDPGGKVLRIKTDGSIPADNPFVGKPGALPAVYTLGHRDPDGLTRDPKTGAIWSNEHGPRGGDELNLIKPGKNYGYPTISYGRQYSGDLLNGGKTVQAGMEQPVYFWEPDIAPSGLTVYRGQRFRQWDGNIFVAGLVGKQLVRLVLKGDRVIGQETLLTDRCDRFRDVREGPDGLLYILTDDANGAVLRLAPRK